MLIIVQQDLLIAITPLTHHGSTDLTESYPMSPALAMQDKPVVLLFHIEGRTIEMGIAQCTTDLEFLTDGESTFLTHDLQFPDTSALASLLWNQIEDFTERHLQAPLNNMTQFFFCVTNRPPIEISRLLIIVVQHLS